MNPLAALAATLFVLAAGPAVADPLRVPVDGALVLNLNGDAQNVVVANPSVIDVTPVALRRLLVIGKKPGQTTILVLDSAGHELFNAPAIVVSHGDFSVTLNRGTEVSEFSCDPRCVALTPPKQAGGVAPAGPSPGGGAPPPLPGGSAGQPPAGAAGDGSPTQPPGS